jgi:DNA-binding transcriptional regulator YhcF (GntR family)
MAKGYIKLHRQIQECWLWNKEKFSMGQAWVDLLLMANHEDKKTLFEGKLITVKKGQFITSILKLSERWKWNRKTVSNFLKILEEDKMVTTERTTKGTTITIVNWDFFQDRGTTERTTERTSTGQQRDINKNDKNDKKERIYNTHFEDCWNIYLKKKDKSRAYECYMARLQNGYSEEELFEATKNYMAECKKNNTPLQYIKDAKTFFGVNTPFVDYIPKKDPDGKNYENGLRVFNVEFPESEGPPFYGLPEDWFENGSLNESKITKVQQPAMSQYGWYKPVEISEARIRELYKLRRSYFEGKSNG